MIPDQDSLSNSFPLANPEELANILNNHLDLIKNHSNELSWLLEQHANLRSEYITFFKKDLKEIEGALHGLMAEAGESNSHNYLKQVVDDFRKDLERSYELLNFTFFWKLAQVIEEAGGSGYDQLSSS